MDAVAVRPRFGLSASGEAPVAWVRRYTRGRAENFSVLSWLLPRRLRDDFAAVYAFCRWSDDLADESDSPGDALVALADWRGQLEACLSGRMGEVEHPIFRALRGTVETHGLPGGPFHALLDAFELDQRVARYGTVDELLGYCRLSANPVGRLVLMLGGYADTAVNAERFAWSDATCTALQLVNHVQDVRRDVLERGRVYLPSEVAMRHGLDVEQLVGLIREDARGRVGAVEGEAGCAACVDGSLGLGAIRPAYAGALGEVGALAGELFVEGRKLWPRLEAGCGVRRPVMAFSLGGEAVLRRLERLGFDTPRVRPRVGRWTKAGLLLRVALGRA